jgi:hypothetical protein
VDVIWLLTGIPALAVFLFVPAGSQLMKTFGPLLMILELGYIKPVADAAIKIKQTTGSPPPMSERLKLAPWFCGLLIYMLITAGVLTGETKVLMGCVAIALGSVSKVWIARRPLQPGGGVGA